MQDAHDRQRSRPMRDARPRVKSTMKGTKKKGGNPITGFFSHAADVVKAVGEIEHRRNENMKRQLQGKNKPRRSWGGLLGAVGGELKDFAIEAATNPAKETYKFFRPDVEQALQYVGAQGPTRFGTGLRATRELGALSPSKIKDIIHVGEATITPRVGAHPAQPRGMQEFENMLEGLNKPLSIQRIRMANPDEWDKGFDWRIPFLTAKKSGRIYIGKRGDVHRQVAQAMFPNAVLNRELMDRFYQGFMTRRAAAHAPSDRTTRDLLHFELGYGPLYGEPLPGNVAPTHKFIEHLFRDYTDDLVAIDEKYLRKAVKDPSPDTIAAFEKWVRDKELNAHRLRGMPWHSGPGGASEDAWVKELISRDNPLRYTNRAIARQGKERVDQLRRRLGLTEAQFEEYLRTSKKYRRKR